MWKLPTWGIGLSASITKKWAGKRDYQKKKLMKITSLIYTAASGLGIFRTACGMGRRCVALFAATILMACRKNASR